MKTLIYIKKEGQKRAFAEFLENNTSSLIHLEEGGDPKPKKLQKAANFAKNENFDLLLDVHDDVKSAEIQNCVDALTDKETPTEIMVADDNHDVTQANENRALLMLQLLTGKKVCGFRNKFRLYPVKLLINIPDYFFADDLFYTRILIQGSRAGYKICNIVIPNFSPDELLPVPQKRFFSIELLKALRPWPTKRLCERNFRKEKLKEFLLHPITFLKFLLIENASPGGLAAAAATGMFLGTLPLLGLHTAAIIYVSIKLKLNKILSVNISHLCMPPFVPFACIEIGYYLRHGEWLTSADFQIVVKELHLRLLDWLLGSLVLAPLNAAVFALITYIIATSLRKTLQKRQKSSVENLQ